MMISLQRIDMRAVPGASLATIWIFLGLSLLPACGREDTDVLNGLPEASVALDLRIDGYEANLVPVAWMGVGSANRLALIQLQDARIRFFDGSGEPVGEFGRGGEGPGEFRRPLRGGWVGDTLWIDDSQLDRTTLISPELELVRTVANPPALRPIQGATTRIPEFGSGTPYAIYPGDTMLVSALPKAGDPFANVFDGFPLLRVSAEGHIARVVTERPSDEGGSFFVNYADGGGAGFPVPFHQGTRWSVSPDGERIALLTVTFPGPDVSTFRVEVVDEHGNEIFDRVYETSTISIPESVIDSVISARAESTSNRQMRSAILNDLKDRIPSMYSPVDDILLGFDARVWVSLRPGREGNSWLVLQPDGEPSMRVTLPANTRVMVAGDRYVWGLETDELGVESVVRYRLDLDI
jgi:hypothetical protein